MKNQRARGVAAWFAFVVLFAGVLAAQDWKGKGRLEGRVLNERGEPIVGATVQLRRYGVGPEVKTDKKGRWAYLGLAAGSWEVDVMAAGYHEKKISVDVSELTRLPIMEMRLEPVPPPAAPPAEEAPKDVSADVIGAVQRGNELLAQKDFAGARAEYEKALALAPNNPVILRGVAQTWYGEKNVDQAIATLQKAVELDPSDTTAPVLLANLFLEKGRLEEGKAVMAKLPADAVKDPAVYVNFGVLLLNQKKPQEAWAYFDQAVRIAPTDAESYFYRGLTAMQLKRNAEAKADLQKYLALAPEGSQAADAKELLNSIR